MTETAYAKGLEGVIAGESTICQIDGQNGRLLYRGYGIDDLARNSTYEETVYLLLFEKLPTPAEFAAFKENFRSGRDIAPQIQDMIRNFPESGDPMELLQSVMSYLSGYVAHKIKHSATCNCRETLHQVAQLPTVIAAYQRFKEGKNYVAPRPGLAHGANFLYMLRGEEPRPYEAAVMDKCMIIHAEHGFNASTFTARVVASSLSTCYSSISAAIGSLRGSLHGGANEQVMEMVDEIGGIDKVEPWLDKTLSEKKKIMGMGHREYRVKDPRAHLMEGYLRELTERKGGNRHLSILLALEKSFRQRMDQKGKPLYPNVDFFSGGVYEMLGIPRQLFTPIFAMARSAGWLAHILEQRKDNRLFRPECLYTGPRPREYVKIEQR
ncbi:MAG TPA: citrate/2-methylcitrate synthase [Chitinivibrionales bacterium]|nr:citrate/2-methylcitrate synthase [Chitinivibrionales bacterium]